MSNRKILEDLKWFESPRSPPGPNQVITMVTFIAILLGSDDDGAFVISDGLVIFLKLK